MSKKLRAELAALKATMPWYGDLEWLKLSNAALRAVPSSPRQKAIKEKMARIEARYRRLKNPRGGKFDRCVTEVMRRGGAYNPYAVCAATLKPRKRRRTNPRGYAARHLFRLIARRGDTRLIYIGGNKFSRHGRPVYFPTMKAAEATARLLMREYPASLRGFSFHALEN